MTKRHKKIRNIAVALTLVIMASLTIYAQKVNEIKKDIERQIADEKVEVDEKNKELQELEEQYDQMDSEEYIRKIATEELGMVDEDTIVFPIKD